MITIRCKIPGYVSFLLFCICVPALADISLSLHQAGQQGQLATIERLVKEGANINAKDQQGRTVLHYAAEGGHLGTVQFLLQKGFDANIRDNEGHTALDYALAGGHEGTAVAIREAGGKTSKPVTIKPVVKTSSSQQTLKPSLKYPDLESFQRGIGQPACVLKSEHVYFFAPKAFEAQAKIVFPYLVKAYNALYRIVGVHTEYIIVVYNFPKGNREGWGGTSNCEIGYDDSNLRLNNHEEWRRYKIPHVSGYIEEMAHNFVSRTKAQFGWEMIGWSLGVKVCSLVAPNPIYNRQVQETRSEQVKTYRRYMSLVRTFPPDIAPNLVDRIHAYLLWKCEKKYGPNFWSDFFKNINQKSAELSEAAGLNGDASRNARYRITVDCFDSLSGLNFKQMLKENGISLITDIKSLHPTEPGWNRKLH
ncbi:MAG: ankyrin repeat domain-containing protein [Phycisphaerae bacterium]